MTDIILYPMALYPPKGEMLIVNDEKEHAAALDAHWKASPPPVDPAATPAPVIEPEAVAAYGPDGDEAIEPDEGPEIFDDAGVPIKRGPGRPRKVIP